MRRALALALLAAGCGLHRAPLAPSVSPDMSGVLAVIGRHGTGHACPIGERLVLTNAHVVDPMPESSVVPLQAYRWSDEDGHAGMLQPAVLVNGTDLALMVPSQALGRWYERAVAPPKVGEALWLSEYDYGSEERAYSRRPVRVSVVRVVAGNVVFRPSGAHGSSGSCVLNAAGQLVAINAWGRRVGRPPTREVGLAVGVWGDWFPTVVPALTPSNGLER